MPSSESLDPTQSPTEQEGDARVQVSAAVVLSAPRKFRGWESVAKGYAFFAVVAAGLAIGGVGQTTDSTQFESTNRPGPWNYLLQALAVALAYSALRRPRDKIVPFDDKDAVRGLYCAPRWAYDLLVGPALGLAFLAATDAGHGHGFDFNRGPYTTHTASYVLAGRAVLLIVLAAALSTLRWTRRGREEASVNRWWRDLGPEGRLGAGLVHARLKPPAGSPRSLSDGKVRIPMSHAGHSAFSALGGSGMAWLGFSLAVKVATAAYNHSQRDRLAAEARARKLNALTNAQERIEHVLNVQAAQIALSTRKASRLRGRARISQHAIQRYELTLALQTALEEEVKADRQAMPVANAIEAAPADQPLDGDEDQ
jgi:hypothetical protein